MKKTAFLTIISLLFTNFIFAQLDCSNFMANRKAEPPFKISSLSKSAAVVSSPEPYKYEIPLQKGKVYRIMFFASPVFNNQINFEIIDKNTGKTVLKLPGENPETNNAKGTAALAPYQDPKTGKDVHPYFDFIPQSSTTLEVVMNVLEPPAKQDEYGNTYTEKRQGCVAVIILERPINAPGFQNTEQNSNNSQNQ